MTNLAWLLVLMIVIFIHELGHFLVARWCGVKVDTFSIGFGREIAGFHDRHGTRWKIGWIPLGGYVKFMDDENGASVPAPDKLRNLSAEDRAGAFHAKPVWQRAAVVAAGPAANFLSAIAMFAIAAYVVGVQAMPAQIEPVADGPAARAGIQAGDLVTRIDGVEITEFSGLQRAVSLAAGRELVFEVDRQGERLTFKITPEQRTMEDGFGGKDRRGVIGVRPHGDRSKIPVVQPSIPGAILIGIDQTWRVLADTVAVLTHPQALEKVGGLPTVIDVSNKIATFGIIPLIQLMAVLSVSIGFINLLPIPMLDGGHLMFYAAEAVRGRPLSDRTQEIGYRIGLALVCSLMVLALWNDRFRVCKWIGLDCSG